MNPYIILICVIAFNALGNFLTKVGANKIGKVDGFIPLLFRVARSPFIISAVICFALNFTLYAMVLNRLHLSTVYPIMLGLSYVIIILLSLLFLKETITLVQVIGMSLVLVGVLLIVK